MITPSYCLSTSSQKLIKSRNP